MAHLVKAVVQAAEVEEDLAGQPLVQAHLDREIMVVPVQVLPKPVMVGVVAELGLLEVMLLAEEPVRVYQVVAETAQPPILAVVWLLEQVAVPEVDGLTVPLEHQVPAEEALEGMLMVLLAGMQQQIQVAVAVAVAAVALLVATEAPVL